MLSIHVYWKYVESLEPVSLVSRWEILHTLHFEDMLSNKVRLKF